MAYFDFENGVTPLNDTNVNEMQDRIQTDINQKKQDIETNIAELTTYSTDERQIGTWIDGKPLYERTISGTKVSDTNLVLTIANNIDYAFIENGSMKVYSGRIYPTLDRYQDSSVFTRASILNGNLEITSSTSPYANGEVVATIRYTKTTD